jgi:cell division initiation protein
VTLYVSKDWQEGHVKVSPMDIQKQVFGKRLRGYDKDEVRTYLTYVAEEVASLQRERDTLEQEVSNLRDLVDDFRSREAILKNTLITTQRLTEELKENAHKQAEGIVREAELQADRLLELARSRSHEVEASIVDLRAYRQNLRADIRSVVQRISNLLDLQEQSEDEDNLRILMKRKEA